jgi:hypothetical protein
VDTAGLAVGGSTSTSKCRGTCPNLDLHQRQVLGRKEGNGRPSKGGRQLMSKGWAAMSRQVGRCAIARAAKLPDYQLCSQQEQSSIEMLSLIQLLLKV